MPLTTAQINLLHEVYECPQIATVIATGGTGVALPPLYIGTYTSVQTQLKAAIDFINQDVSRVTRVGEILAEYEGLALDPSPIERDGYSFSASRNLKAIRRALYPLTGILWNQAVTNRTPLG